LHKKFVRRFSSLAALCLLSGCGLGHGLFGFGADTNSSLGQTAPAASVFGYVVADEPQAALVARSILNNGGNAADAAAAAGFAMAVTLPSRGGLGGGGACIIKMPDAQGTPQPAVTLSFPPGAPAAVSGSRPAAIPTLARGLLAMQARYGALPLSSVVVPAERLAGGVPVSPSLAADLQVVGSALLSDPAAAAVFSSGGREITAGGNLIQPDLAATLEVLRTQGVQGFYAGVFASQFIQAADAAGGGLSSTDLNASLPVFGVPDLATTGSISLATLPVSAPSQNLPASAGFAAVDKNGGAVACAVTMNNLFGTGRIAPGTGVLLAASPRTVPTPILAAGLAYSAGGKFRAAVTGTGQQGAALAVTSGLQAALAKTPASPVPDPGRANIISCPGLVPGGEASCTAAADPRGNGLAIGSR
jgi:gamma-glutamyltranspeptidase/glutathione hydrolase